MKGRGRKRTPGEKQRLLQVAEVFSKKVENLGAKKVAEELNICLASVYKYAAGDDLPRDEVLWRAHKNWGIKWDYVDFSRMLRVRSVRSPEQLRLWALESLREEDVEVVKVASEGGSVLRVVVKIQFPAFQH
jgi:hypothetical protein